MKWTSHKLLTGAIVFTLTGNPIPTFTSVIGSVLPDAVEGFPDETSRTAWRRSHRKFSHFLPTYLIGGMFLYSYAYINGITNITLNNLSLLLTQTNVYPQMAYLLSWICFGAILHILEDALCGKVPLLNPTKKEFGVKLFYVGSLKEYAIVIPISILLILLRFKM